MRAIAYLAILLAIHCIVGGWGDIKQVSENQDLMNIVSNLKPSIESSTNIVYTTFNPTQFRSQVVAGTNYKVKIDIGNGEYIHVKIYVPLPFTKTAPTVSEIVTGMKVESEL